VSSDPDTDPIRIQGFADQKLQKKIYMKNFVSKIAIYLCPSYRRRRKSSKENIQQFFKFINFFYVCGSFLPFTALILVNFEVGK
jgi:hypothetical protein